MRQLAVRDKLRRVTDNLPEHRVAVRRTELAPAIKEVPPWRAERDKRLVALDRNTLRRAGRVAVRRRKDNRVVAVGRRVAEDRDQPRRVRERAGHERHCLFSKTFLKQNGYIELNRFP